MKRTLFFVFLVLALALTACAPVVVINPQATQAPAPVQVNVEQTTNVIVGQTAPCSTCSAAPAPQPTAETEGCTPTEFSECPEIEPLQPRDWSDTVNYPEIFKGEIDGKFYCGARAAEAEYPEGFKTFETWPKTAEDGNYLHADKTNEYSMYAFCHGDTPEKHFAPSGTLWTEVLLENNGLKVVTFPLE